MDFTRHLASRKRSGGDPTSVTIPARKTYECSSCGKCFATSSYLSQHVRIHNCTKNYQCQLCERRFTQLCHLQQHIRTHTGAKPYRCQHQKCDKSFSQLSNLRSHTRTHMTDKPFRCNSCHLCFFDEQSLSAHIPQHAGTKRFKTKLCAVCGKSYAQDIYLARHLLKHQQQCSDGSLAKRMERWEDARELGIESRDLLANQEIAERRNIEMVSVEKIIKADKDKFSWSDARNKEPLVDDAPSSETRRTDIVFQGLDRTTLTANNTVNVTSQHLPQHFFSSAVIYQQRNLGAGRSEQPLLNTVLQMHEQQQRISTNHNENHRHLLGMEPQHVTSEWIQQQPHIEEQHQPSQTGIRNELTSFLSQVNEAYTLFNRSRHLNLQID